MEWEPGIALQYPSLPPLYPTLPILALATLNHHTIVPIIRILEYCMVPCGGCGAGDGWESWVTRPKAPRTQSRSSKIFLPEVGAS